MACSLAFHAITFEHSSYTKIAFFKNEASVAKNQLVSLFHCLVARSCGNRQTDRHTYKPSTITLAAHARRGLMNGDQIGMARTKHGLQTDCEYTDTPYSITQSFLYHTS